MEGCSDPGRVILSQPRLRPRQGPSRWEQQPVWVTRLPSQHSTKLLLKPACKLWHESEEVSSNDCRFHKLYSKRIFEKTDQKPLTGTRLLISHKSLLRHTFNCKGALWLFFECFVGLSKWRQASIALSTKFMAPLISVPRHLIEERRPFKVIDVR